MHKYERMYVAKKKPINRSQQKVETRIKRNKRDVLPINMYIQAWN